jgi:hypothetical protein
MVNLPYFHGKFTIFSFSITIESFSRKSVRKFCFRSDLLQSNSLKHVFETDLSFRRSHASIAQCSIIHGKFTMLHSLLLMFNYYWSYSLYSALIYVLTRFFFDQYSSLMINKVSKHKNGRNWWKCIPMRRWRNRFDRTLRYKIKFISIPFLFFNRLIELQI